MLLLDGVPQADPFGGWVNWPSYVPAGLAEVRVVRGGGGVATGPGALAGMIELTSRRDVGLMVEGQASSGESSEATLVGGMHLRAGTLNLSARAARGAGFVPVTASTRGSIDRRSPFSEASIRALWASPIGDNVNAELSGLGFVDKRERGLPFTGNQTFGADAAFRLLGSGRLQWSALAYVQWRELSSSFAAVNADRSAATRASLQDEVPSQVIGGRVEVRPPIGQGFELRLGGDIRRAEGETRELFAFVGGKPTRRRKAGGSATTAGLFGELTSTFGPGTFSAGARIDYWSIRDGALNERTIAGGTVLRDELYPVRTGWLPTARASALVRVGSAVTLRSAAYLGRRMPTLNELFRPFRAGPMRQPPMLCSTRSVFPVPSWEHSILAEH